MNSTLKEMWQKSKDNMSEIMRASTDSKVTEFVLHRISTANRGFYKFY